MTDELEEIDEQEFSEPEAEDYVMCDSRRGVAVSQHEGNFLGEFDDRDAAEAFIRQHAGNFWPNVWFISDHGNAHLIENFKWEA